MRLSGLRTLLVIGVAVAGCDISSIPGPPRDLGFAAATNTCGPADGPAVEIFLVPESMSEFPPQTPYARLYVARSLQELDGQRWELTGPDSEGGAWYHTTANDFEVATYAVVTIHSVSADSTVRGEVNLLFPSGRHVWGGFTATWFSSNRGCV